MPMPGTKFPGCGCASKFRKSEFGLVAIENERVQEYGLEGDTGVRWQTGGSSVSGSSTLTRKEQWRAALT